MHDFVAHVLRRYYAQTEWNPFNSYLYLTHSSQSVLDFAIPNGLSLSISASPSPPFFTTYRLRALPTLTGALGYVFASVEDNDGVPCTLDLGGSSRDIRFKELVDGFRIVDAPRRPTGKEQVWQGGRRVDGRDYLLYGCIHIPSVRVDALVASRLSPTWQLLATAISMPPRSLSSSHYGSGSEKTAGEGTGASTTQQPILTGPPPGSTNLHINLQNDTGRWFTEYSYSVDDGLLGFRVLHNLGQLDRSDSSAGSNGEWDVRLDSTEQARRKRVDEESGSEGTAGGGLQGRFSVGAEVFFSPLEKSAGLSTGMRFTTLPETSLPGSAALSASGGLGNTMQGLIGTSGGASDEETTTAGSVHPTQPPTTITATLNPMMGHLSTAYAARMTRDIVACSRFDFNVYSYESELTLGAEYWLRSNANVAASSSARLSSSATVVGSRVADDDAVPAIASTVASLVPTADRQLSARAQGGVSLRDGPGASSVSSSTATTNPMQVWSLRQQDSVHGDEDSIRQVEAEPVAVVSEGLLPESSSTEATQTATSLLSIPHQPVPPLVSTALGVLKARISTSGIAALLWEGKLRNCLVSFGIRGDLSSYEGMTGGIGAGRPLRGVGIDVIYFSQNGQ